MEVGETPPPALSFPRKRGDSSSPAQNPLPPSRVPDGAATPERCLKGAPVHSCVHCPRPHLLPSSLFPAKTGLRNLQNLKQSFPRRWAIAAPSPPLHRHGSGARSCLSPAPSILCKEPPPFPQGSMPASPTPRSHPQAPGVPAQSPGDVVRGWQRHRKPRKSGGLWGGGEPGSIPVGATDQLSTLGKSLTSVSCTTTRD